MKIFCIVSLGLIALIISGCGGADSNQVDNTGSAVNDPPIATDGILDMSEDSPSSSTLTASDPDGDGLTYTIVTNGTIGTASITNSATGAYTYTPDPNANGSDTFTFKVNDGASDSNIATQTVTIAPLADPPEATDGTLNIDEDTSGSGTLSASDPDGNSLTYIIVANGTLGTVSITNNATGAYTYTPNQDANGTDIFTFKVTEGFSDSNTATQTINIDAVNDMPDANSGSDQGVWVGDTVSLDGNGSSDAESDPLTYVWSITSKPAGSTASVSNATSVNASFTADIEGSYTVQLIVNDGNVNSVADTMFVTAATVSNTAVFDTSTFDSTAVYGN